MSNSQRSALLDANLLILDISARIGFRRLRAFSRVQVFTETDIELLARLLTQFRSTVTTSYILAETSNLANKLTGQLRSDWYSALAQYAVLTTEVHVPTAAVGILPEVARFGISDAALRHISETHTVITSEFRLAGYLEHLGLHVINFNHVRSGFEA
jgi:hypothetical protein